MFLSDATWVGLCIFALTFCRLLIFAVVAFVALRTRDEKQRVTALEILRLCTPWIVALARKRE